MTELLKTPLYNFHVSQSARLVPFAGYEMPVQYSGILQEHLAVRKACGLFDVSHMGEARVQGPQARNLLNHVATNDVGGTSPGKAIYSPLCNDEGGVVDDVIIYCHSDEDFLVVLNAANTAKDLEWLEHYAKDFDCTVTDESPHWAQLALQGPAAFSILEAAGLLQESTGLKRFGFRTFKPGQCHGLSQDLLISRTGYTGEDGVELYCRPEEAESLAHKLMHAGKEHGLLPCGLGARDSLRLEAGLPLYGHEIDDNISPLEAGLSWTVKFSKGCRFVGESMLETQRESGPARRLIHFTLEGRRIARQDSPILQNGVEVGKVVSGTHSPMLDCPIGSALIQSGGPDTGLEADIRGNHCPVQVRKAPLHR